MSDVEKKLSLVETGKLTHVAYMQMAPLLAEQHATALTTLINEFRAGKPAAELYSHIATLSSLSALEASIRLTIKRGEAAAGELYGKNDR